MRTTPFEQFVGRATRIGDGHVARATIITHVDFGQQANYRAMRGGNWALPAVGEEE